MSFELIPFSDLKGLLTLDGASVVSYPSLSVILYRLLPSFEQYTGRQFELMERTETIFVNDLATQMLFLPAIPVASISSIIITSNIYGDETLGSTDYDIVNYGVRLISKVRNCKVTVVYTGGLSAVTNAIKAAALYQAAYELQGKDQIGAESVSNEGGSVYRPALGLLKETKRMLASSIHPLNTGAY